MLEPQPQLVDEIVPPSKTAVAGRQLSIAPEHVVARAIVVVIGERSEKPLQIRDQVVIA